MNKLVLSEVDFLNEQESTQIRESIFALREHWENRTGFLPFFTLGAASYLDAPRDDVLYKEKAQKTNPLLLKNFSALYQKLSETLSKTLNIETRYEEGLGLPGFHIFLACKAFENPVASTHFDLQFKNLKWNYQQIDFAHPVSFTCPIILPKTGAGLLYWEIYHNDAKKLSHKEIESLKREHQKEYFPYSVGKLILHQGLILHQIAPSVTLQPDDERITLQGHGLICDGILRLYW